MPPIEMRSRRREASANTLVSQFRGADRTGEVERRIAGHMSHLERGTLRVLRRDRAALTPTGQPR